MRIEQLEYLCEIAKRKSMNVASTKLFVSQQALSTAIRNLEKELDTKLLERTYHGVFPTENGQELIDISQRLFAELDQLKLKIATQNNSQVTGTLRIAIEPGINRLIMPKIVISFYKYYPNIHAITTTMSREEIKKAVAEEDYDIGIITNYPGYGDDSLPSELISKRVIDFQLLARVNRRSPLSEEDSVSLRTLLNYPLALNTNMCGSCFMDEIGKYGTPYILPTNYDGVSQELVLENLAVSLAVRVNSYLPFYFNNFDNEIVNIPIVEDFPFSASYIIHDKNKKSKIIEQFIDSLIRNT